MDGLYPGGLNRGGGFKVGFYGTQFSSPTRVNSAKCRFTEHTRAGADPGGGKHCLGHGQIFGRAKQLFCLLVLLT